VISASLTPNSFSRSRVSCASGEHQQFLAVQSAIGIGQCFTDRFSRHRMAGRRERREGRSRRCGRAVVGMIVPCRGMPVRMDPIDPKISTPLTKKNRYREKRLFRRQRRLF